MKNIKAEIKEFLIQALSQKGWDFSSVKLDVEETKDKKFGDYATNLAMQLASSLKISPLSLAEEIAETASQSENFNRIFEKAEAVKPGFVNFYLSETYLKESFEEMQSITEVRLDLGQNKKIQVEFISANPTGPLTLGNGRGGFYGDVLCNIFAKCGYDVTREYLVNDAGNQIVALGNSVLKNDQAVYKGGYIDDLHEKIKETDPYEAGKKAAEEILKMIRQTIEEKMRIKFDVWFSERQELRESGELDKVLAELKSKKLIYEKDGAWWFASSEYGDTRDRVLIKSNGEATYLAQDFAYLKNKFSQRNFDRVINIWGADHHGDVPGLLNAAKVLGYGDRQEVILTQFIRLFKDGHEFRMSKRRGTYITIDELIDMVGHDPARFNMLMYSSNSHIDFDINKASEVSQNNPVYYVQYAYARLCSILRETKNAKEVSEADQPFEPAEKELIKELIKYPDLLKEICESYAVNNLTNYSLSLAEKFHSFYNSCRVIDNGCLIKQREKIIMAVKNILGDVLDTVGISRPNKM